MIELNFYPSFFMVPEIESLLTAGQLTPQAAENLDRLEPGAFCHHRSWGYGRIASLDIPGNQIVIDFENKPGHGMQLQYAGESLVFIPNDHIHARRVTENAELKQMAQDDPVGLMRIVLRSMGGQCLPDQVQQALSPSIIAPGSFKKWWESTKRLLKKDGHFQVPPRKTERIILRETAVSRSDELIEQFEASRSPADQIVAADEIIKHIDEFSEPSKLQPVCNALAESSRKMAKLQPLVAFDLALACEAIAEIDPKLRENSGADLATMLREHASQLDEILPKLAATKQRRLLALLPEALTDQWLSASLRLFQIPSSRTVQEVVRLLIEQEETEQLLAHLDKSIRDHSISSDTLVVVCRQRDKTFKALANPRLFRAILSAIERDQFSEIRRGGKLQDLMVDDQELLTDLLQDTTKEEVRDALRTLMFSSVFEELSKRSLMARIIKMQPELEALMSGGSDIEQEDEGLVVSWESMERRKKEYEELVTKKIPENTKDISIARSYGDLRENFEFKSAKEQQAVLMRRKAELELALDRARGTDFTNADTSVVSIGTIVRLKEEEGTDEATYTILGAWDSDPDHGVISYQTSIGQSLLGHKVGEIVEIPTDIGSQRCSIEEILPYRQAEG